METLLEAASANMLYLVIGFVFIVGMVTSAFTKILTASSREKSRREIAAYIAEGSIDPAQGERLLRAEIKQGGSCCT